MGIENMRRLLSRFLILALVVSIFTIVASGQGYCDIQFNGGIPNIQLPSMINVSPNPVYVGQTVTIKGSGWNTTPYPGDTYPLVACVIGNGAVIQPDGTWVIQSSFNGPGTTQVYAQDKWGHMSNTVNLTIKATPQPTVQPATPTPTMSPTSGPTPTQSPQAIATPGPTVSPTAVIGTLDGPIDATGPQTTLSLTGIEDSSGAFTSNVVCTLQATDNTGGSGVNNITYSFDGNNWTTYVGPFTVSTLGNHTVFYRSTDIAGNQDLTKVKAFTIVGSASATAGGQEGSGMCAAMLLPLLLVGFAGIYGIRKRQ